MTASQKAILLAMEFPEGEQGKRSDLTSSQSEEVASLKFPPSLVSNARKIVKYALAEAEGVLNGTVKFAEAVTTGKPAISGGFSVPLLGLPSPAG